MERRSRLLDAVVMVSIMGSVMMFDDGVGDGAGDGDGDGTYVDNHKVVSCNYSNGD